MSAAALFGDGADDSGRLGRAVHRLLAGIEWWEGGDVRAWAAERRAEGEDAAAVAEAAACLEAAKLQTVFARPAGGAEVWRERAFEAVIDDAWVSGVFDRVVLVRGPEGVERAAILDFKTDREVGVEELRHRHAAQLELYRRALSGLTGLAAERIVASLVATDGCRLVPCT